MKGIKVEDTCVICGKGFLKYSVSLSGSVRRGSARPSKCMTCSPRCSRIKVDMDNRKRFTIVNLELLNYQTNSSGYFR